MRAPPLPAPLSSTPPLRLAAAPAAEPPPRAHTPSPLPATGVVLIGTRQTVEALRVQVEGLERAPVVTGCILVGGATAARAAAATPAAAAAPIPLASHTPILGSLADLPTLHARYGFRFALISIPAFMTGAAEQARAALEALEIPSRPIPTLTDLLSPPTPSTSPAPSPSATVTVRPAPQLDLAALVGRDPHPLDRDAIARILTGKRILITGAGGSIGSELARVAAAFNPELLILMERSENALFEINRHMAERFPHVPRKAVLHDVVDAEGTLRHLVSLRPHAVYHAAAHKHVPLMEDHPAHAVTNNLFGTKAIADAAVAVGAERFVLISTDKAVNPVSIMGASKRLAEMYVRSLAVAGCATRLSMVRFGNVLGSAGSVLTIWANQLAEAPAGAPPAITVTDPRMTRYFMTIPEAAALVIQASTVQNSPTGMSERSAPVYVLDMGSPVRILDLARRFLAAHGLRPATRWDTLPDPALRDEPEHAPADPASPEAAILFSGARPGEKLHEQLAYAAELLRPTGYPGINAWAGPAPEGADALAGLQMIADLSAVRTSPDRAAILAAMRRHIPEMPVVGQLEL